jgi:ribosomal protein L40E
MKSSRSRVINIAFTLLMLMSYGLIACGAAALSIDTKATLYIDEYWEAETNIIYAAQQIQLTGGMIDQGFATAISQWRAQGISADLNKTTLDTGNTKYRLTLSGQGFAKLNAALFDNTAQIVKDTSTTPPQISFKWAPVGTLFGLALSRTFTLKGGKVLSSNGSASNDSVTWINPTQTLQATVTPASRINLPLILGIVGGAVLLGSAIFFIARQFGRSACPNCGAKIPRGAEFCPECGAMK